MSGEVSVNGRFRVQALTGVQRFASEIVAALPAVWPAGMPSMQLVTPGSSLSGARGHAWEQAVLPFRRSGLLVNLGNTAPVLVRRQLVVIHDAGVAATPEAYSTAFRIWYPRLQQLLAWRGARIATVSETARGEVARALSLPTEEIDLLSEGAEHILAQPADAATLGRHGLQPRRYVLVVGSLAAHKNLTALGVTARMLAERELELVITGGLDAVVFGRDQAPLPQPACYVGRVSDPELRALYENAACFLFPSRYEGFGLPAVEAMACGCPVIAARIPALMEICGDCAVFCDPLTPSDIAAAVASVLDAPDLTEILRDRGLKRAAHFTWARAARLLVAAISRLSAECHP